MLATMPSLAALVHPLRLAVDMLLPPHCAACEGALPWGEPIGLCPTCYAALPWWDVTRVLPPTLPTAVDAFTAPFLYEGILRDSLLKLKFNDATYIAAPLAKTAKLFVPKGEWLMVPVPMHASALRVRFYNQAALLAQELARLTGQRTDVTALTRVRPSDGQAKRTRAQRLQLSSADFVAHGRVSGRNILLVDDIYTTGATARACALALKKAGAARVHVFTLAYTAAG